MDSIPDVTLREVFSFVPPKAFLPICHVSHRFHRVWLSEDAILAGVTVDDADNDRKFPAVEKSMSVDVEYVDLEDASIESEDDRQEEEGNRDADLSAATAAAAATATEAAGLRAVWAVGENTSSSRPRKDDCNGSDTDGSSTERDNNETNNTPTPPRDKRLTSPLQLGNLFKCPWNKPSRKSLNVALLQYFVENGWEGQCRMKRVLTGAAARGDIEGMEYIFGNALYDFQGDVEICTVAAAAGQLEALKWLREVRKLPWDPTEVHRESSENLHDDVMDYVEKNSEGYEIQLSYGVGLPW